MLAALGGSTSVIAPDDVAELAPYLRTEDIAVAAYEPESGYADARGTIDGFLEAGQRRGGEVFTGTSVTRILARNGAITGVETTEGSIRTPVVVLAAGAWSLSLLRQLGLNPPVTVSLTQWIGFEWDDGHSHPMMTIGDGALGSYFRHLGDRRERILVGLGGGARRTIDDPDDQPAIPDDTVREAHRRLSARLAGTPSLHASGGGSGPITLTPDDLPIIDRHPEITGLSLFTGDGGACFKTAPAIGNALTELAVAGRSENVDVSAFHLNRFDHPATSTGQEGE